ncbi:MAG: hypothetical protein AVDCRST_MAG40-1912, partial [uncultured Gemmatimonadaceae bacterium]
AVHPPAHDPRPDPSCDAHGPHELRYPARPPRPRADQPGVAGGDRHRGARRGGERRRVPLPRAHLGALAAGRDVPRARRAGARAPGGRDGAGRPRRHRRRAGAARRLAGQAL